MTRLRIMTNFRGGDDEKWAPHVSYIAPPPSHPFDRLHRLMRPLRHAWLMFRLRRNYDLAIIAASTYEGSFFCLLQALLALRMVPVLFYECLWDPPHNRLKRAVFQLYLRVINRVCYGYVIFSRSDRLSYAQAFRLPLEKLYAVPYCTTLSRYHFTVQDDGYIFAGGDSLRDYDTLFDAMEGLPYRLVVATNLGERFRSRNLSSQIVVRSTTHEEFRTLMAGAAIHVLPLAGGLVRSVGHQTYLNGMALGKPVIVTDRTGTAEYIEDGVDGVVVDTGDANALRKWIVTLMEDPALREKMGARAAAKAAGFSGSAHLAAVLRLAVGEYTKHFG